MNSLEFALKMELDGKAYYEKLASETSLTMLKTIFTSLAADEQKHYDTIKQMQAEVNTVMVDSTVLEMSKKFFLDLINDKSSAEGLKESLDGYKHAMKVEADSVKFYDEEMAAKESNPDSKKLLFKVAEEEKKHYNIMDNLYDYTLEPQYFLAWSEFSNIKEL